MCGIAGYYQHKAGQGSVPNIVRLTGLLAHRGPDDSGCVIFGEKNSAHICSDDSMSGEPKCIRIPYPAHSTPNFYSAGLGHRRLAIIDLSPAGHQPMMNEDGTIWVSFNGEIYNYKELKRYLTDKGHCFRSTSDTEVLVHGYEEWGEALPLRLRGMFAFAVWDSHKQRMFLARDHFGIKPLYYAYVNGTFLFASEIKSILAYKGISRELDYIALDQYLSFLYIPEPRTIYASIRAVPPAHYLSLSDGRSELKAYWKFKLPRRNDSSEESTIDSIREVFEDSVKAMMVSDVPIGVFLSGGIDSTSILSMMTKHTDMPIKTFSIGFGSMEKNWDELDAARSLAAFFKTEHHEFNIKPNVVELLPRILWNFDQPFANPTSIILYLLSGETRRRVKVALAGTGGDEMFAGYPRYKGMLHYQRYGKFPSWIRRSASGAARTFLRDATNGRPGRQRLRRFLEGASLPFEDCYLHLVTVLDRTLKRTLYSKDFASRLSATDTMSFIRPFLVGDGNRKDIERLMVADLNTYLPFNQLVYSDRMSMARSLEVRVPFVDQRVAEMAAGIPLEMKLSGGITKGLFRRAMAPFLPKEILKAPKQGLNLPISLWFRKDLKDWMESLLSPERVKSRGYFIPDTVQKIMHDHLTRQRDHSLLIWALIVLEIWHQQYVDNADMPFLRPVQKDIASFH